MLLVRRSPVDERGRDVQYMGPIGASVYAQTMVENGLTPTRKITAVRSQLYTVSK
jgi:hypothetical protein